MISTWLSNTFHHSRYKILKKKLLLWNHTARSQEFAEMSYLFWNEGWTGLNLQILLPFAGVMFCCEKKKLLLWNHRAKSQEFSEMSYLFRTEGWTGLNLRMLLPSAGDMFCCEKNETTTERWKHLSKVEREAGKFLHSMLNSNSWLSDGLCISHYWTCHTDYDGLLYVSLLIELDLMRWFVYLVPQHHSPYWRYHRPYSTPMASWNQL